MPHLFRPEIITQMKRKGYELPPTVFVGTDLYMYSVLQRKQNVIIMLFLPRIWKKKDILSVG